MSRGLPMKKKLGRYFTLITALAILLMVASALFFSTNVLKNQIINDLKAYAHLVNSFDIRQIGNNKKLDLYSDYMRITLIDSNGNVLIESREDVSLMDNHSTRPEVQEALRNGDGWSVRFSNTVGKEAYYYAIKKSDGTILRVSKDTASVHILLYQLIFAAVITGIIIFIIIKLISRYITYKFVKPIEILSQKITKVDEKEVYEEMRPFIRTIKEQHINVLTSSQIRQEFTSNVSHELKTPLTAISGYAELIESGVVNNEDTVHFAAQIRQNSSRLLTLINDIIELSRLDNVDTDFEKEQVDLYQIAQESIDAMSIIAAKNNIVVKLFGEPTFVNANRVLMSELFHNLYSNALRYNKPNGTVTVTVKTLNTKPYLCVEDTGIGIPKECQPRVFERFYRVDKSHSKSTGGTGLGLAIVKHIAALQNARIELESELDIGTKIEIFF